MTRPVKGAYWERLAERWLRRHGLETLARNYRCRQGEIDLVMRDRETTVFVEVRYRQSASHGQAHETVHGPKQQRLARTASHFLATHPRLTQSPCRFDVIGVAGNRWRPRIQWLQDAFRLD